VAYLICVTLWTDSTYMDTIDGNTIYPRSEPDFFEIQNAILEISNNTGETQILRFIHEGMYHRLFFLRNNFSDQKTVLNDKILDLPQGVIRIEQNQKKEYSVLVLIYRHYFNQMFPNSSHDWK
jgi:hypothetical protein